MFPFQVAERQQSNFPPVNLKTSVFVAVIELWQVKTTLKSSNLNDHIDSLSLPSETNRRGGPAAGVPDLNHHDITIQQ